MATRRRQWQIARERAMFELASLRTVVGPAPPASGHATLVKSSPAVDSVLSEPPPAIQAWFSEEVAVKGSVMRLYDGANAVLGYVQWDIVRLESLVPPDAEAAVITAPWSAHTMKWIEPLPCCTPGTTC